MKPILITGPKGAEHAEFASFNAGQHICIAADGSDFTVSVRTPSGKRITFAFLHTDASEDYECVDIDFTNSGLPKIQNGDIKLSPFDVIGFCKGSTSFDTRTLPKKPSLITVLLGKRHYEAKGG